MKQGLTIEALAEAMSTEGEKTVSPATIQGVECGKGANNRTITRIADALGIHPRNLYDAVDEDETAGVRSFQEAVDLFGYCADLHFMEIRVDLEGNGFCVHHVEGFHSTWFTGSIRIGHHVNSGGHEYTSFSMREAPFEILRPPQNAPLHYRSWMLRNTDGPTCTEMRYEINLPAGIPPGDALTYRYAYGAERFTQTFAEESLVTEEMLKGYGDPPDVPPDKLAAFAAPLQKRYTKLRDDERRAFPPCLARLCATEFPAKHMTIMIRFPKGYRPPLFKAQQWRGNYSFYEELPKEPAKIGALPEVKLMEEEFPYLRLDIEKPYMCVCYAVLWWPPVFEEYWPLYQKYLQEKKTT